MLETVNQFLQYAHKNLDRFEHRIDKYAALAMVRQKDTLQQELHILTHRNSELKMLLARLCEDKLKGEIVDDTFLLLANEFEGERDSNIKHGQEIQEKIQRNQYLKLSVGNFKEVVRAHKEIEHLTRELLY